MEENNVKKRSIIKIFVEGIIVAAIAFTLFFGCRTIYALGENSGKDEAIQIVNGLLKDQNVYLLDKYSSWIYHDDIRMRNNNWGFVPNKTIQMKYDMGSLVFNYVDYDSLPEDN